ncbi:hypothetical protein [Bradyrhizobium sp. SZCCHNS3052]|uniref:hypothetical protein n=1 Tax=Bradyrhizobium sp. SZCCHNS3052 TaxID=3057321 RepID=UPI002916600D|nr:hypothetical protein [Bradyrhizobium sp. SZCCHNS3052]
MCPGAEVSEWLPVVRPGMFAPLQMRRRSPMDGRWLYRDPTEAEIRDYIEGAAW